MRPSDYFPEKPINPAGSQPKRAQELWARYPLRTPEQWEKFQRDVLIQLIRSLPRRPTNTIMEAAIECMDALALENDIYLPELPYDIQVSASRNVDLELSPARIDALRTFYLDKMQVLLSGIGSDEFPDSQIGTVPFAEATPFTREYVSTIVGFTVGAEVPDRPEFYLFHKTRAQIMENVLRLSGHRPGMDTNKLEIVHVADSPLQGAALAEAYLKGTPWLYFMRTRVPFDIELARKLEHIAIVAGSGAGKTQLLQSFIMAELEKDDPASLIVLDSTGQMTDRLQHLAVFSERLRDRLVIIDPAFSPPLNMFDIAEERMANYSEEQREDMLSEIVSLFNYIFSIGSYDITARMTLAFNNAVKLIFSRKGTLTQLRQLLEEPAGKSYAHSAFKDDIDKQDQDTKDFFTSHFFSTSLTGTRIAVAQRLHQLISIPALRRMFTASHNALDLYGAMQAGKIILVNTNANLLKKDYVVFGRYVIARALAGALERAAIPANQRKPAFLVIDEAAPYFDTTLEELLTRVRQFKLGVVIAFQYLAQANERLLGAIASSTAVKFTAQLDPKGRRWFAQEMETAPEFFQSLARQLSGDTKFTEFATFIRNVTPSAIKVSIPIGRVEDAPQMDQQTYQAMLKAVVPKAPIEPSAAQQPPPPEATTPEATASPTQAAPPPEQSPPPTPPEKPADPIPPTKDTDDEQPKGAWDK